MSYSFSIYVRTFFLSDVNSKGNDCGLGAMKKTGNKLHLYATKYLN